MGIWGPGIFAGDLAMDIRREYGVLLAAGLSEGETEKKLLEYYAPLLGVGCEEEPDFWFALALTEWKRGRLSEFVKNQALCFIDNGQDLARWRGSKDYKKRQKVIEHLRNILLSSMPPAKKVSKTKGWRSPWREGSLLAYQLITNTEYLQNKPTYHQYALLRVVRITRCPLSSLIPMDCYDEEPWVSLYGWIGDEIPNPSFAKELDFIPIDEGPILSPDLSIDFSLFNTLPKEEAHELRQAMQELQKKSIEYAFIFGQTSRKEMKKTVTLLECDENYEAPEKCVSSRPRSILSDNSLDIILSQRLFSFCKKNS